MTLWMSFSYISALAIRKPLQCAYMAHALPTFTGMQMKIS